MSGGAIRLVFYTRTWHGRRFQVSAKQRPRSTSSPSASAFVPIAARRRLFEQHRPSILSLIGPRQVEQFLHHGLGGRLGLTSGVQLERKLAVRKEVAHMIDVLNSDPDRRSGRHRQRQPARRDLSDCRGAGQSARSGVAVPGMANFLTCERALRRSRHRRTRCGCTAA